MNTALHHALTDSGEPAIRELPADAAQILVTLGAPPRLAAHLRAVHDVAHQLTAWLGAHYPELRFDRDAVLFGAATHDIGKAIHTAELSGPGFEHEAAGPASTHGLRGSPLPTRRGTVRTWSSMTSW